MGIEGLAPSAPLLLAGLLLDAVFGDPQVSFHPVRLIGNSLSSVERFLRRGGWNGRGGGIALFSVLVLLWVLIPTAIIGVALRWFGPAGLILHIVVIYV